MNFNKFNVEKIKMLVFDQYGTIVDMQKGLTDATAKFLVEKGWKGEPHRFVTWWRRTHFEDSMIDSHCNRGHTKYRQIGERAVSFVMDRCGIKYTQDEVRWLISLIERLKPFPDVINALQKLKNKGYKLTILSNGDRDMLETSKKYIGFKMDFTISVEEVGYFKPNWNTYKSVRKITGVKPQNCLFVANHTFDCVGAKANGMFSAFINRRNRPFGKSPYQPDIIFKDFESLANFMI